MDSMAEGLVLMEGVSFAMRCELSSKALTGF
jgi:hypothetical protein